MIEPEDAARGGAGAVPRRGGDGAGVRGVPAPSTASTRRRSDRRGLRPRAADDQGGLPRPVPAAGALPRRSAGRMRHGRGLVRLVRPADGLAAVRARRALVDGPASSRSSTTASAPTSAAPWRWSASRSATGSAACTRPHAAGTWPRRATRSRWPRPATTSTRSCAWWPSWAALRPGRAAGLPAVRQERHRRRPRAAASTGRRYRIKLVLAGEVFSEEWRDLSAQRAGNDPAVTRTRHRCTAPPTPACWATRHR